MGISKNVLLHELAEADINVDAQSLASFIRDDVLHHTPQAAIAYLEMAQVMAKNLETPQRWSWFRRNSAADPAWEWCSFEGIQESAKMIEFVGTAQPSGKQ